MKVLVIGSGGREHALVWKIAQSPHVSSVWCAPGNAGTALEIVAGSGNPVENAAIGAEDIDDLAAFAGERKPDLTVVGPDNPLALGIVDRFQEAGFRIWGPSKEAARFESSKIFSHHFMHRHGIPTAKAAGFSHPAAAKVFVRELGGSCVVKADGLALGKGALVCESVEEADEAVESILEKKVFGDAGNRILVQERLVGREVSFHAICDGTRYRLFPPSQDYKRAFDGGRGRNTGGMGACSPPPFFSSEALERIGREVLEPWLAGCQCDGIDYRGILYPGLMLTDEGPKVLEFNSRFGDPEAQVYLRRLQGDLVEILEASIDGSLDAVNFGWSEDASVCIVVASDGYPGSYASGRPLSGIDAAEAFLEVKVFLAGTRRKNSRLVTSGGRVLGVTANGDSLEAALKTAYAATEKIRFDGAFYRTDIGEKAIL